MSEFPATKDAANIGFALLDELVRTLVAKGILSESEVVSMLDAAAERMTASKKSDASISAAYIRDRILRK